MLSTFFEFVNSNLVANEGTFVPKIQAKGLETIIFKYLPTAHMVIYGRWVSLGMYLCSVNPGPTPLYGSPRNGIFPANPLLSLATMIEEYVPVDS